MRDSPRRDLLGPQMIADGFHMSTARHCAPNGDDLLRQSDQNTPTLHGAKHSTCQGTLSQALEDFRSLQAFRDRLAETSAILCGNPPVDRTE